MARYENISELPEKYQKQVEAKIGDLRHGKSESLTSSRKRNKNRREAKSGTKYGNKKVEYDGHIFDSKKEARKYAELKIMEDAGEIINLRLQVPFELVPPQAVGDRKYRAVKYIADFVYVNKDRELVVLDVKGYRGGPAYRMFMVKKKLMLHRYGVEIQEV